MRVDFTYDQFGRVLSESRYSNAVGTALVARTTYTYDAAGNATSMVSEDIYDTTLDEFYYTYTDRPARVGDRFPAGDRRQPGDD